MIHIAPCSCELHVRIRELEAEVKRDSQAMSEWSRIVLRERARAEKAEARVAELEEQRLFDSRNYEPEREAD